MLYLWIDIKQNMKLIIKNDRSMLVKITRK